ncbi:MAG: hypothetical protein OQK96_05325, partial [Gammaproteobacteria bacterium]|nr:hypothetical protein [Gammaproteobacteria bacterium]
LKAQGSRLKAQGSRFKVQGNSDFHALWVRSSRPQFFYRGWKPLLQVGLVPGFVKRWGFRREAAIWTVGRTLFEMSGLILVELE